MEGAGLLPCALTDVVEQHIERPDSGEGVLDGSAVGEVGDESRGRRTPGAALRGGGVELIRLDVEQRERGALIREAQGGGPANAVGGTGDRDKAAGETLCAQWNVLPPSTANAVPVT